MKIQTRLLLIIGTILLLSFSIVEWIFYRNSINEIEYALTLQAERMHGVLMATRRVYHKQFVNSGMPLNDKTLRFLPAHAMARISDNYESWNQKGVTFNNVSDRPRNPVQMADQYELEAMSFFRNYPKEQTYFKRIHPEGSPPFYLYTRPIWIEPYCLQCHGSKADAPEIIKLNFKDAYGYKVGDLRGLLSIQMPAEEAENRVFDLFLFRFMINLGIFSFTFLGIVWVIRTYVSSPLQAALHTVEDYYNGNEMARMPAYSGEIGEFSKGFNQLADRINASTTALAAKGQEYRQLVEIAKTGIIKVDAASVINFANPYICLIFQKDVEDIIGSKITDFIAAKKIEGYLQSIHQEDTKPVDIELTYNQSLIMLNMQITPILDPQEEIIGWIYYFLDITDRIQKEHILQQAMEDAKAASQAKDGFFATMSHELRTPMNGVMGMAQILEDTKLDEEQKEYVEIILRSGSALVQVLANILNRSRIQKGESQLFLEPVQLKELGQQIYQLFRGSAGAKQLELEFDSDPQLEESYLLDRRHLNEVLTNLVANGIKFTQEGKIRMRFAILKKNKVRSIIRFEVQDSGIGIAPEQQSRIFDSFTQVDESSTRQYGGVGLGLNIVKEYVKLQGGRIQLESELGKGSHFWFELSLEPVSIEEPSILMKEFPPLPGQAKTGKILIVEDESANQVVISSMLTKLGYQFISANNGVEALEILQEEKISLILMDCIMPVMDGFQATGIIRQQQKEGSLPENLPIIATTAKAMPDDRKICMEAGMDDYLAKPLLYHKLEEILLNFLGPA